MAKVWRNERYSEHGRERERKKEKEGERERLPEPGGKSGREDDAKGKKYTKRRRKRRREWAHEEKRERRGEEVGKGTWNEVPRRGRKAVLLMGPLSVLAALCDLQLKSSPSLPAFAALLVEWFAVNLLMRRALARDDRTRVLSSHVLWAAQNSVHARIQSSFWIFKAKRR